MFVRFKRRRRAGDSASLDAVIVENSREGRRIRQRVICYLATVHESTAGELRDRVLFWETADKKMDRLDLDRKTRQRLAEKLSLTIAYAPPKEREQYRKAGWKRIEAIYARA